MQTEKYVRKPFYIDAVQVTEENIAEVATWCDGELLTSSGGEGAKDAYVKVRVHRPLNERQTKAFVGDWVLFAGTGYKVYTKKAFEASFEKHNIYSLEDSLAHNVVDGVEADKAVQAEKVQPV
jgi:hypothetical protein